jgi:hypothetical protein
MAIRAVVSADKPTAETTSNVFWSGTLGVDGDDGVGLTTSAILGFFPDAVPGTWYSLSDFSRQVELVDWTQQGADQWTSLEIQQDGPGGVSVVSVDVKLEDAVRSLCVSSVDLLSSFKNNNIWVRFE